MIFNSIFVLLLLSCKIAAGYIMHNAGYMTYHGEYYGSQAKMGAWGVPDMNPNSSYEVSTVLLNFDIDDRVRLIKAGLHVYPELYHDNKLPLFISANDDANRTNACYNINCRPSFVVANPKVLYPGQSVEPLSQYDGIDYHVTLSIKKDPVTEFWTVYKEDFNTSFKLGWWEKGLLGDLDNKTTSVQWFGFVTYQDNDEGPTMGSGHYPIEGDHKAAYMTDLKLFYKTGTDYDSPKISDLVRDDDKPECYRSAPAIALDGEIDEHKFYYGGPAGCRN